MVLGASIEAALSGVMIYHARDHSNAQACNGAPPRWPGRRQPHLLRSLSTPCLSLAQPLGTVGAAEATSQLSAGSSRWSEKRERSRAPAAPAPKYLWGLPGRCRRRRDAVFESRRPVGRPEQVVPPADLPGDFGVLGNIFWATDQHQRDQERQQERLQPCCRGDCRFPRQSVHPSDNFSKTCSSASGLSAEEKREVVEFSRRGRGRTVDTLGNSVPVSEVDLEPHRPFPVSDPPHGHPPSPHRQLPPNLVNPAPSRSHPPAFDRVGSRGQDPR